MKNLLFEHNILRLRCWADRQTDRNPRCACASAARVTVVGFVCVCFTSGASVRPEMDVTYSTGNEGKYIGGVFFETASLRRSSTPSVVRRLRKARMRISCIYHVVWTEDNQGQCDAPIRLKVCKSCQCVFRAKRQIEHTLQGRAIKRLRVAVWDVLIKALRLSSHNNIMSHYSPFMSHIISLVWQTLNNPSCENWRDTN